MSAAGQTLQNEARLDMAEENFRCSQMILCAFEARSRMKQDIDNIGKEQSAIEEITKTLNEVHFASTIKLNVGGKIYKTTLDTLRKDPDSMLCAMFSGKFELKVDEDDGAYFIDRDAEVFRYILNYLRNNELLYPDDKITRRQLLTEAKFYQIQGIVDQLEEEMFPSSVILKDKLTWLPHGAICSLLFRASDDGKRPADFHRCCDNKGPTVVLIKHGEFILGGYTSKSWQGESTRPYSIPDSQSFLFILFKISGNERMVKISPKSGAYGGIICRSDRGPSFGSHKGCDLQVLQDTARFGCDTLACKTSLGYGFQSPKHFEKSSLTSGLPFKIDELEVFHIEY